MDKIEHERRIDYIEFAADDLDKIRAFYSGAFGWDFTDYGDDYTSFQDGRLSGGFMKVEKMPPLSSPLVVLYSGQLEVVEEAIVAQGGRITRKTFEFPGGRRFHFKDPVGNQLAVWSDR